MSPIKFIRNQRAPQHPTTFGQISLDFFGLGPIAHMSEHRGNKRRKGGRKRKGKKKEIKKSELEWRQEQLQFVS